MKLEIKLRQYPNGTWYGEFFIDSVSIGRADDVLSNKWIPFRKRKPLSEFEAAKSMLKSEIKRLKDDLTESERLLSILLSQKHVRNENISITKGENP